MKGGIITMVMGIIAIAIAFIIFPIVMDATGDIITHVNIADFTGLESIAKVAPLMVFIGLLAGGGFGLFKGVTAMRGRGKRD